MPDLRCIFLYPHNVFPFGGNGAHGQAQGVSSFGRGKKRQGA